MIDMRHAEEEAKETFRSILRGESGWRALERYGVTAQLDRMPATYSESQPLPVVIVTVDDLRRGYSAHLGNPRALREWAQIMEMCGCYDFEPVESDPDGEEVLDALWALAFGEQPATDVLARPVGVSVG